LSNRIYKFSLSSLKKAQSKLRIKPVCTVNKDNYVDYASHVLKSLQGGNI